jgi:hypothetical protein
MANTDDAGDEVDICPAQREHLGEAHARVRTGEKERPIPARAGDKKPCEFWAGEDALVGGKRMRPLVTLEPVEGVSVDVTAPQREGEDAAERGEDPLDRPRRKASCL